eukprot:TRINITY_DN8734_c0_g1_i1.p1 TRINITY_DN8734_c0_g1~~TRINITY_DN8734_c0_g1_i1.p1  ORF type:complete len:189 (-),score=34.75 TRINITY_DN8734_c0_g1_i1:372-938(-)
MSRLVKISDPSPHTTTLTARFQQIQNSAPAQRSFMGTTARKEGNSFRTRSNRTTAIAAKRSMPTTSKPTAPIVRTASKSAPRSVTGTRPQGARGGIRANVGVKPKFASTGGRPGVQKSNGNSGRRGGNNNSNSSRGGRGGGRRPNKSNKKGPLSKESLDKELNDYMSGSKAGLDKDLDQMMSERTSAK